MKPLTLDTKPKKEPTNMKDQLKEAEQPANDNPLPPLYISTRRGPNATFAIECESNIKGIKVPIALCPFKPHAALIVRAVNSHEALVEALRDVQRYFDTLNEMQPNKDHGTEGRRIRQLVQDSIANAQKP